MKTALPDEHGWYWVKIGLSEEWCMAFVDTHRERLLMCGGDEPHGPSVHALDENRLSQSLGECEWYGPLTCPGGDFGSHIVIASEEDHRKAAAEHKVIGITHFDFRYCRDERHGSSLTVDGTYSREEASRMLQSLTGLETP